MVVLVVQERCREILFHHVMLHFIKDEHERPAITYLLHLFRPVDKIQA